MALILSATIRRSSYFIHREDSRPREPEMTFANNKARHKGGPRFVTSHG